MIMGPSDLGEGARRNARTRARERLAGEYLGRVGTWSGVTMILIIAALTLALLAVLIAMLGASGTMPLSVVFGAVAMVLLAVSALIREARSLGSTSSSVAGAMFGRWLP